MTEEWPHKNGTSGLGIGADAKEADEITLGEQVAGVGEQDQPDAERRAPISPEIIQGIGAEVNWIGALGEGLMVGEIAEVVGEIELA